MRKRYSPILVMGLIFIIIGFILAPNVTSTFSLIFSLVFALIGATVFYSGIMLILLPDIEDGKKSYKELCEEKNIPKKHIKEIRTKLNAESYKSILIISIPLLILSLFVYYIWPIGSTKLFVNILGLSLEIIGVGVLIKEFFKSEHQIALETATYFGHNKFILDSMIKSQRNSIIGFIFLLLGFVFQLSALLFV